VKSNFIFQENNLDLPKLKTIISTWAKVKDLIQSVYLYGSRIRGNYQPDSDLDITIKVIPSTKTSSPLILNKFQIGLDP
jgi:predicted nucleotidyltransferase